MRRLRCLHLNDSQAPLGSNRDRHAPPGDGELGPRGCAAFLSEPRFEKLPILFEGPGVEGKAPGEGGHRRACASCARTGCGRASGAALGGSSRAP